LNIKNLLVDVENYNFTPIESSELIDNGLIYENLDISYIGDSPDLGAYEYSGEYWVPGITWDLEHEFGENFIYPDNLFESGDINNDSNIDILDVIQLVNIIINDINESFADINNDQNIDILDVIQLVNIILN